MHLVFAASNLRVGITNANPSRHWLSASPKKFEARPTFSSDRIKIAALATVERPMHKAAPYQAQQVHARAGQGKSKRVCQICGTSVGDSG